MRVLSVTHGPDVPGGIFEQVVEASGHELERWVVPSGGAPDPAGSYGAVMAFGGSMHPDEDERFGWLEHEEAFLRDVLDGGVPAIGVCLGAQMLARAAGAEVGPARVPEIGWHGVELTPEGRSDPVLGALPPLIEAFQWHRYTFGIPERGVELARSPVCTQAFRVGTTWGIQFHAEVTLEMVLAWAADEPEELPTSQESFAAAAESRITGWNELGRRLCTAFLEVAQAGQVGDITSSTTSLAADA
ncbi:MAG TPA: type 1 glutamine amidotransferase [Gaiellaceae bacterium]|nr:type 1 glutamine amidotransferase [Gaiellaceae bacterium]